MWQTQGLQASSLIPEPKYCHCEQSIGTTRDRKGKKQGLSSHMSSVQLKHILKKDFNSRNQFLPLPAPRIFSTGFNTLYFILISPRVPPSP